MPKYAVNTIGIKALSSTSLTIRCGVSSIGDALSRVQCILDSNQTAFESYKDSLESVINDIHTTLKEASELSIKVQEVSSAYENIINNDAFLKKDKRDVVSASYNYSCTSSFEEEDKRKYALAWMKRKKAITKTYLESGKTEDELKDILLEEEKRMRSEFFGSKRFKSEPSSACSFEPEKSAIERRQKSSFDKRSCNKNTIDRIRKKFIDSGAVVSSDDDEKKRKYALLWLKRKKALLKEYEASGKTKEYIKNLLIVEENRLRAEYGM